MSTTQSASRKQSLEMKHINSVIQKQNENLSQRALEVTKENNKLRQANQKLQQSQVALQKALEKAQQDLSTFERKDKEREEYVKKLKSRVTAFRGMPLKKVLKLKDKCAEQEKQITQMQQTLTTQQQQILVLNDALELQAQNSGVQGDLLYDVSHLRRENVQLNENIYYLQEQVQALSAQNHEFQINYDHLSQDNEELVRQLEQLNQELNELRETNANIAAEQESLKADNDMLMQTLDDKNIEFSELQEKFENLENTYTQEKETFEATIKDLQAELDKSRNHFEKLQQDYTDLSNAASMDGVKLNSLYQKSDELQLEVENLTEQLQDAQAKLTSRQAQLDQFVSLNAELDARMKSEESQKIDAENALALSRENVNQLSDEIEQLTIAKNNAIEVIRKELEEKEQEMEEILNDKNKWKNHYEALVEDKKQMETKLLEYESHENELKRKIEKVSQTKNMVQQTLLQQINSLKQELKEHQEKQAQQRFEQEKKDAELTKLRVLVNARHKSSTRTHDSSMNLSTSGTNILEASREILRNHQFRLGGAFQYSNSLDDSITSNSVPLSTSQSSKASPNIDTHIRSSSGTKNHSSNQLSPSGNKMRAREPISPNSSTYSESSVNSYENKQKSSEYSDSSYFDDDDDGSTDLNSSSLMLGAKNVLLQSSPAKLNKYFRSDGSALTLQEMMNV